MYINESPGGIAPDALLTDQQNQRASFPIEGFDGLKENWRPWRNGVAIGALSAMVMLAYSDKFYRKVKGLLGR